MDKMNRRTTNNCVGLVILDWIESILGKEMINGILELWYCNKGIDTLAWLYITACGIKRKEVRKKFEYSLKDTLGRDRDPYVTWELLSNAELYRNEKQQNVYIRFSMYDGGTGEGLYAFVSIVTGGWIAYSDGAMDGQYDPEYDQFYSERVQEWLKLNIPELAIADAE